MPDVHVPRDGAVPRRAHRVLARSVLAVALIGVAALAFELRPAARADAPAAVGASSEPDPATAEGNPEDSGNWRYCAIDGFLSSCCGGTQTSCPPGTEMSSVTWLGTCRNPADGKDYVISYNDCCGKSHCGRCFTQRNEGDKPVYFTPKSNDINWCLGSESVVYNSTVAVVVGTTAEPSAP